MEMLVKDSQLFCLFWQKKKKKVFHPCVDLQYLAEVRRQIPVTVQKRDDLYAVNPVTERWGHGGWGH